MRKILLLAAALAALLVPRAAHAQPSWPDSAYLKPGDVIRLAVWRQPDFSGDFPVSPEGTVQHPLLAGVRVVDVSRAVVRQRLYEALSRYERDPQFVFDFLYRVAVGGEVRLPNLYPLSPETTIAEALATAGGVTEFGRHDNVRVIRDGQTLVVNLRNPDSEAARMRVRSGDQIRVSRRGNVFRDYIGPGASIVAAAAALISVVDRN